MLWLLMTWRCKEPGHQQPWYWHILLVYPGFILSTSPHHPYGSGTILCMRPANERRRYNVTSSLIGWAHTRNNPCGCICPGPTAFQTISNHHTDYISQSWQWRHNGRNGVSNHQPHDCLLNRLFGHRSKKTSKLHIAGLCAGNSPGTCEFLAQMASDAENVSIWWHHHV